MKGTVFGVALNHQSQLIAWQNAFNLTPYKSPPKTPVWFIKPRNTVIGSDAPIPHPVNLQVQSGATIALIVGVTARKVSRSEAHQYIAGYALANEVSLPEESFYRPAIKSKCRDGFCPLGNMVNIPNVDAIDIITEVNGQEVDRWNTRDLCRNASELLSALSQFATLTPGDTILLGTPQTRITLHLGDQVRLLAAGFPELKNSVIAEGELL